jgi:DNA-directed RNA polymerase specialized sigma24 family protein
MTRIGDLFYSLSIDNTGMSEFGLSPENRLDELGREDVQNLASLAAAEIVESERCRLVPLGVLLPSLSDWRSEALERSAFDQRLYRILRDAGIETWGHLASRSPAELSNLRGAGRLTVRHVIALGVERSLKSRDGTSRRGQIEAEREDSKAGSGLADDLLSMLQSLAEESDGEDAERRDTEDARRRSQLATQPHSVPNQTTEPEPSPVDLIASTPSQSEDRLLVALRTLSAWGLRIRNLEHLGDLFDLAAGTDPIPRDLSEQWVAFSDLRLSDLADAKLVSVTLDDVAAELLAGLDDQQREVFEQRIVKGRTLEDIGQQLGVSRERIRQVQQDVERLLAARLRDRAFLLLLWRAAELYQALGTAAPLDHEETQQALAEAWEGASFSSISVLRPLILRLAGPYKERDGWLLVESTAPKGAKALRAQCDEFGLLPVFRAHDWLVDNDVRAAFHDAWLERFGGLRREDDTLVAWPRNIVEKCVSLLALRKEPADAKTLVELVGEGHNVRGVQARFFEDDRLMRVNKTHWALRTWGLEEYTGITDEIAQRIEEAGGQINLQVVIQAVAQQFSLKESSVTAYSAAPMFVVEDDIIRLRRDGEPIEVGERLKEVAGVYRTAENRISLLVVVDREVLRGSGRPLGRAVAVALGVKPSGRRKFQYENGELTISWPLTSAFGPSLGSVRALVEQAGAVKGERIRLDFDLDDEQVAAERVPHDLNSVDPTEALRLLTGIQADVEDGALAVARAIDSSPANCRGVLNERGDKEVLELLPSGDIDPLLESTLSDLATAILRE